MEEHFILWDQIIHVKTKLSEEKFNSLLAGFYMIVRKALDDGRLETDLVNAGNIIFDSFDECRCNSEQICLKKDIRFIRNCRNYEDLVQTNPIIELIFENKIVNQTTIPIIYTEQSLYKIKQNVKNLFDLINVYIGNDNYVDIFSSALYEYLMKNLIYIKIFPKEILMELFAIDKIITNRYPNDFFEKINFNPFIWKATFSKGIMAPREEIDQKIAHLKDLREMSSRLNLNLLEEAINTGDIEKVREYLGK